MKEWFSAAELAGNVGLPTTERRVRGVAMREYWRSRKRSKGKGLEYHLSSLPFDTQLALISSPAVDAAASAAPPGVAAGQPTSYDAAGLWAAFDRKPESVREEAANRAALVQAAVDLDEPGGLNAALRAVARSSGTSWRTLQRWYYRARRYERSDWGPALASGYVGNATCAKCDLEAWEFFKADYLRLEQPSMRACYERLVRAATEHGWQIPGHRTLERRIDREIPRTVRVLLREGERALADMYPAQQRHVAELHALQWINGDGYQHNVFVRWPDGTIARPKTWFWQDVFSRRFLAWRTDQTEHTDLLRLSFGDVVERYGIPEHATIDNTRAAANKWLTGGIANRYRFTVRDEDPLGILPLLGVRVHWTTVVAGKGHGQAKPVERHFGVGGIGEVVDKHPAFAGAWTGNKPDAKPENYASAAVPLEQFLNVLHAEVNAYNDRTRRRTEACGGTLSFDQAFRNSYERAPIRKATSEQRRLWLLAAEGVKVLRDATVTLDAGKAIGVGRNRYHAPALFDHIGRKVVVRFDPQHLHGDVQVYTLDGCFVGSAACIDAVGFGDTEAGRAFNRARKEMVRAAKRAAEAEVRMTAADVARHLPAGPPPEPMDARVVRSFTPPPTLSGMRPPEPSAEDKAYHDALVLEMRAPKEPNPHQMNDAERWDYWQTLDARIAAGESLSERAQQFYEAFRRSDTWRVFDEVNRDLRIAND